MRTRLLTRTTFGLGACLVAALLFAACGGGDDDDTANTQAVSTTAATDRSGATTAATEPADDTTNGGGTSELVDNGDGVACPLVTTTQISDATGTAMTDGVGQGGDDATFDTCTWNAESGPATVNLDFFKQDADLYYNETSDDGKTDVASLGEKARWSTQLSTLEVLEGDYYFVVYVHTGVGATDEGNEAAATAVAQEILDRLG